MLHEEVLDRILEKRAESRASHEEEPTVVIETTEGDEDVDPAIKAELGKAKVSSVSVVNIFRNPDAHPLTLDLVLLRKYGPEWMAWELETLQHRLQQDFRAPSIADVNIEKLQACKTLHMVDDFWLRWEVFNPCCAALNGHFADFRSLQVPEVAECMVAVDIANRIRDDLTWSEEIRVFLSAVHRHGGVLCPQAPLDFISVDTEGLPVDCKEVTERWPGVRGTGKAPSGDSVEDEQLRRLLASWAYLEITRQRLKSQLSILQHVD